ncbi:MAG: DUF2520 domain-containing protein [Bacteroidaceae bacterium]|nr:DUF2520 domain-containing protein [Bacteroidaceae bacterium]
MKVTLIGSGNLATNLGHALKEAQVEILQIYSRTAAHAQRLATELCVDAFCEQICEINTESDVYIVSIKDDALALLTSELQAHLPEKLIVHTAGSMPMDVLKNERRGVFYPMQTFSRQHIVSFAHIPIFIEAVNVKDLQTLLNLATLLSDSVYELSSDNRKWLHIAAVFCCNFTNHMATLSARVLERHGIPFRVMLPLMEETIAKLHLMPPDEAQTGPAARGDERVLCSHVEALKDDPELAEIYKLISNSISHD